MAFDSDRGVAVLFGGRVGNGHANDTWEWNGSAWRAAGGPQPLPNHRDRHAMAYDSRRRVMVLFGGYDGVTRAFSSETWEHDGARWRFRTSAGPRPREYAVMAYDERRGVTVLHGGSDWPQNTVSRETWEWNGDRWEFVDSRGSPPSRSYGHTMVYDSHRGVMVLYGGNVGTDTSTHEFDGEAWRQRSNAGPVNKVYHAMAFDRRRGVAVVMGGFGSPANGELWEWDGVAWSRRFEPGPGYAAWSAMVYDSWRDTILLHGGTVGLTAENWFWHGPDVPALTAWPADTVGFAGRSVAMHMVVRSAFPPEFSWHYNGTPLANGPTGTGSVIEGADSPNLRVRNVSPADNGEYIARVHNTCGNVRTPAAQLQIRCPADCDISTGLGVLDVLDFHCFQNAYAAAGPYACDCDSSTGSGVCDVFDFLCFLNAYAAGCP